MMFPTEARVMSFIVTRDRAMAKAFYGGTLGLALSHEDDFAAVFDLNGIMLRIATVVDHEPSPHTVLGWEVPDIAHAVRELRGRNVVFRLFDGLEQDALGIWPVPGGRSKVAWFADPDGNLLSLTQSERTF